MIRDALLLIVIVIDIDDDCEEQETMPKLCLSVVDVEGLLRD
jgi:hypothetical protein